MFAIALTDDIARHPYIRRRPTRSSNVSKHTHQYCTNEMTGKAEDRIEEMTEEEIRRNVERINELTLERQQQELGAADNHSDFDPDEAEDEQDGAFVGPSDTAPVTEPVPTEEDLASLPYTAAEHAEHERASMEFIKEMEGEAVDGGRSCD